MTGQTLQPTLALFGESRVTEIACTEKSNHSSPDKTVEFPRKYIWFFPRLLACKSSPARTSHYTPAAQPLSRNPGLAKGRTKLCIPPILRHLPREDNPLAEQPRNNSCDEVLQMYIPAKHNPLRCNILLLSRAQKQR